MKAETIFHNRIAHNALWLIGGRVANKLLAFLVGVFSARYLGPGNYGLISYATAFTAFFASVCTLGLPSVIVKEFVENTQEEGLTLGTALAMRAISGLLAAVMTVSIVLLVDGEEPVTVAVVALSAAGLVFQIFDTVQYWFQARLLSKFTAAATVLGCAAASFYKIWLLISGKTVMWFAVATSLEHIVCAAVMMALYFRAGGRKLRFSAEKAKKMLKLSSGFILSGLMISVYSATDKLMLKHLLDETAVGHYGAAISLSAAWVFVLQAVISSVQPSVMALHGKDYAAYEKRNRQMYALVIYLSLVVSTLLCICAPFLVRVLYGAQYLDAVRPMRILVWYAAFSYLGVARNAWVVCEGKQKYLKYVYFGAAVVNVALNLWLIPRMGSAGAAWASLVTQISTVFVLPVLIRPLRPGVRLMVQALLLRNTFSGKNQEISVRK